MFQARPNATSMVQVKHRSLKIGLWRLEECGPRAAYDQTIESELGISTTFRQVSRTPKCIEARPSNKMLACMEVKDSPYLKAENRGCWSKAMTRTYWKQEIMITDLDDWV